MSTSGLMPRLCLALLLLPLLLAAYGPLVGPADGPPSDAPPRRGASRGPQPTIRTEGVQVSSARHIRFEGRSTLPDGTRLQAQLSAENARVRWWPDDTSAEVQDGRWQLRVLLGAEDTPPELSPEKEYVLRVWESGNPDVEAAPFPFDVSGPPAPQAGSVTGTADVEAINVLILESFPVQVAVVARGHLHDTCTEIDEVRQSLDTRSNTFRVEITTTRDPDEVCAQALAPFEERIALDVSGLAAGTYTVDVSGVTDTFRLDIDNWPAESSSGTGISWDEARVRSIEGRVRGATQALRGPPLRGAGPGDRGRANPRQPGAV